MRVNVRSVVDSLRESAASRRRPATSRLIACLGLLLLRRRTRFRKGSDEIEDGAELAQAHTVAIKEFLQRKIVIERIFVIREVFGQLGHKATVRLFENGQNFSAGGGKVRELFLPSSNKGPPAGHGIVGCGDRPKTLQLLTLAIDQLTKEFNDLSGNGPRFDLGERREIAFELEVELLRHGATHTRPRPASLLSREPTRTADARGRGKTPATSLGDYNRPGSRVKGGKITNSRSAPKSYGERQAFALPLALVWEPLLLTASTQTLLK